MKQEEFIADLFELKNNLSLQTQSLAGMGRVVENATTYSLVQTLIALFCDKYKVDYRNVILILEKRNIDKQLAELTPASQDKE